MGSEAKMVMWLSLLGLALIQSSLGAELCVKVVGNVICEKDSNATGSTEIALYDRDGHGFLKLLDPDDLFGKKIANDDGTFEVEGCADDQEYFPFSLFETNEPEPYVQIFHFCGYPNGKKVKFPIFSGTFKEMKNVILDDLR